MNKKAFMIIAILLGTATSISAYYVWQLKNRTQTISLETCSPTKVAGSSLVVCSTTKNTNNTPIPPSNIPELKTQKSVFSLIEKEFDFGKIKQSGGYVEHTFVIRYDGEKSMKIIGVPTSCACTTAKSDKTELNKGDILNLTVTFDPNLHEEPDGKFFKTVSILTEPSIANPPELKIWAEIDLDLGENAYKLKSSHEN